MGQLTFGKKKFESLDGVMRRTIGPLHETTLRLLPLVDQDTAAFSDYMVSLSSSKEVISVPRVRLFLR